MIEAKLMEIGMIGDIIKKCGIKLILQENQKSLISLTNETQT